MSERHVNLRIDRLVLRDVPPEERTPLVNSLRQELARLFGTADARASISNSASLPVLRLSANRPGRGPGPARALGRHVAQAIGKRVKS